MTTMHDIDILQTLQTAAIAAVSASTMPNLPIKAVGRSFTPPSDQKYLELVYIPNHRTGDFYGNEKNYQGLFRLILHWKNDDKGAYEPLAALSSIASYFSKEQMLGAVQITENPNLTGVLEEPSETLYPCSIRFVSFRP